MYIYSCIPTLKDYDGMSEESSCRRQTVGGKFGGIVDVIMLK